MVEYRAWCDEYRIRTEADCGPAPPPQAGGRRSAMLTERAAMKLAEAGRYMASCHGGFRTFLTLTFDAVSRARLALPKNSDISGPWSPFPRIIDRPASCLRTATPTTIQSEVSRFFDGARKMHYRGWVTRKGRRVPGSPPCHDDAVTRAALANKRKEAAGMVSPWPRSKRAPMRAVEATRDYFPEVPRRPLRYCWVAENPVNASGEQNPHVHVLMDWGVPYHLFKDWAVRLEKLWGQGFAHLEKIREAQAATGYLLKALGYMTKGAQAADQGPIRGNRYAISQGAHAPPWVTIEKRELRALGALIADIADHCQHVYARQQAELRRSREECEAARDASRKIREQGREPSKERRAILERARRRLERCRRHDRARPIVANRYRIICRGRDAFREVRTWLGQARHYPSGVVSYLPEKPAGEYWEVTKKPPPADVAEMRRCIGWRRQCREAERRKWTDWEWMQARDEYEQCATMLSERELERAECTLRPR
ncbi:rolling circle replication-associated protein [Chromatocurvus halotolerans]|uniref:rolling circle replication-associated protein n=1 Tax=Chromatocurvus halotolerans TaxID=1132028 RepID=UPI001052AA06|nr:hypothetical protein [Chromatocurvus halotolerans]